MDEQNSRVPPELGRLSAFIDAHIECVAGPSSELRSIALHATKHIFDWALETEGSSKPHLGALLAMLTETTPPQTRSRARSTSMTQRHDPSRMHKRHERINIQETPLTSLFIEGMSVDQIWQQLDLRAARVCENLQILQGEDEDRRADSEEDSGDNEGKDEDEGMEMDVDDESLWEGFGGGEDDDSSTADGALSLEEEMSEGESEDDDGPSNSISDAPRYQQELSLSGLGFRGSSLDDGFFDLATFNAETSGEVKESSRRKRDLVADNDSDSSEESEIDLFGSVDDLKSDGASDGLDLFYNAFFEPPPEIQNGSARPSKVRFHERVSVKKIKAVGRGMPVSSMGEDDSDDDDDDDDDDEFSTEVNH